MKISIFCTIFAVVLARFAFILFKKKIIRMKKILLGLLLIPAALWAQTQTLTGKIVKKPWTKSSQSYCAQGSDYLVLSAKDGSEYVLDFSKNNTDGSSFVNKRVSLTGQKIEKVIKGSDDPNKIEQRPINSMDANDKTYRCEVFEVMSVKTAASKNNKGGKKTKG